MTAIIVAGRSGAAFSAELGTMRVDEEIDALRTLGLDPYHFLVFPRVIALLLVLPLMTIWQTSPASPAGCWSRCCAST
jgi:phospholipid/cholesterol/gamma-HCH transport system permease protein